MNSRTAFLAAAAVAALAAPSSACFMRSPQPVQVWLDHIRVDVVDQVAVKTYHCTFRNPNPQAVVGATCYMELEPGAQVDDMSVVVDGREARAEILDVERANRVFTEMVQEGASPALLEYFGNQLIQTKVPRIAANGTVTVKLTYTTVLASRGGLVRLQMLNTNPKALLQPLQSASVTVNLRSTQPIRNVYSPTHEITLAESPEWDITASWSEENYLPTHPFVLYYQTGGEEIGAALLAHRELDEEGAFMLLLSPTLGGGAGRVTDEQVLPKDIVFCVDTSGSMLQDNKMEQARGALRYCIEHLRPADGRRAADRFNIVDFGTGVREFSAEGLVTSDEASQARALRYVERLSARGGTAIEEALVRSLEHLAETDEPRATGAGASETLPDVRDRPARDRPGRLKMIVFATDGLPTIGERDPQAILKSVARHNPGDVRMFVFGAGFGVNTRLLDFLALRHRGDSEYILPDDDIEQKISRFFDRVGSPVLTDLELRIEGLEVQDVFPRKVRDMYRGEQLIVFGRYTGHGRKKVTLTASGADGPRTFEYELEFPEISADDRHAFVPRLWAGQKVDFLLNELRGSEAEDRELIAEITYLAKRYGIVTPYTSFLMAEDTCNQPQSAQVANFVSRMRAPEGGLRGKTFGELAVVYACAQSVNRRRLVGQGNLGNYYVQAREGLAQEGRDDVQALAAVRYVGNRTFYNSADVWYDSRFDVTKQSNLKCVEVGSPEYLTLVNSNPGCAKYLAQGDVVVELGGRWYQFQTRRRG